jgi:hypothetical protein
MQFLTFLLVCADPGKGSNRCIPAKPIKPVRPTGKKDLLLYPDGIDVMRDSLMKPFLRRCLKISPARKRIDINFFARFSQNGPVF